MDLPPEPPSKPIAAGLIDCGLDERGFTVIYDDDLQGYVVGISTNAGANAASLQCIWDAAWTEFVQFENTDLQRSYDELSHARFRPLMRQQARAELAELDLLDGFPERSAFTDEDAYARALETHCGIEPGSMIKRTPHGLSMMPEAMPTGPMEGEQFQRFSCLLSSIMYAAADGADFTIGFVGNEKIRESEGE